MAYEDALRNKAIKAAIPPTQDDPDQQLLDKLYATEESPATEMDAPPTLDRYYGKGPGKNYTDKFDPEWSYRLYDDGSIEIIAAPETSTIKLPYTPKRGGLAYEAIFKQVRGTAPEAPTEAVDEAVTEPAIPGSVDPALKSMASTMPTYVADEEHAKALQEGLQKTLPLEALAEQAAKDAPKDTGIGYLDLPSGGREKLESLSSAPTGGSSGKKDFTPWPSGGLEKLGKLTMQAIQNALGRGE